jgi:hypothetical protein
MKDVGHSHVFGKKFLKEYKKRDHSLKHILFDPEKIKPQKWSQGKDLILKIIGETK